MAGPGFKPRLSSSSVHNALHPGMGFYSPIPEALPSCPFLSHSGLLCSLLSSLGLLLCQILLPGPCPGTCSNPLVNAPSVYQGTYLASPAPCFATAEASLPVFILPAPETRPYHLTEVNLCILLSTAGLSCPWRNWFSCTLRYLHASPGQWLNRWLNQLPLCRYLTCENPNPTMHFIFTYHITHISR